MLIIDLDVYGMFLDIIKYLYKFTKLKNGNSLLCCLPEGIFKHVKTFFILNLKWKHHKISDKKTCRVYRVGKQ